MLDTAKNNSHVKILLHVGPIGGYFSQGNIKYNSAEKDIKNWLEQYKETHALIFYMRSIKLIINLIAYFLHWIVKAKLMQIEKVIKLKLIK